MTREEIALTILDGPFACELTAEELEIEVDFVVGVMKRKKQRAND